jgi:hypothetical protein
MEEKLPLLKLGAKVEINTQHSKLKESVGDGKAGVVFSEAEERRKKRRVVLLARL